MFFCQIRVTFVNELGVEEAGVDGGGIFKDFMEGITKTGFDVQYGLFKVHHYTIFWYMPTAIMKTFSVVSSLE